MGKTMDEQIYYENHQGLTEPGFPVISREYAIRRGGEEVRLHWHEGVELLYVLAGSCKVARNLRTAELTKGDMALISAGQLHRIFVDEEDVRYEYLILERELWEELSLPLGEDQFTASVVRDEKLTWMLKELAELRGRQGSYVQIQKRGFCSCSWEGFWSVIVPERPGIPARTKEFLLYERRSVISKLFI